MQGSIVLDASVIAAIFFDEDATDEVREIVARYRPITVDWVYAEVGNIAWKRIAKFKKDPDVTKASVAKCLGYLESCSVFRGVELCESALELAVEHRITFYDALYVAASKETGAPLYTLDKKLGRIENVKVL
jgi:predicted nucleic acid-binding protein